MSPNSTPNPSDRAGSQPSPSRPRRVLPPELARIRSRAPAPADIKPESSSFISRFRSRLSALPLPVRRTFRVLRILTPIVPIGIFFSEHVLQVMWVRGPSMTPYLNENYTEMSTRSDMVLVNMWQWVFGWPWERSRRLERGMVVTFR
jgi:mitochondrial inner membrane protease subunit 2